MNIKRKIYYIATTLFTFIILVACGNKSSSNTVIESSMLESTTSIFATESEEVSISEVETSSSGSDIDYNKFDKSNYQEVLELVIAKGNDWSSLPLSDKFRETYEQEEGIIERKEYIFVAVYDDYERSFSDGHAKLGVTYDKPKYVNIEYDIYFTVNDKGQLDTVELKFDKEEEQHLDPPLPPRHINIDSYDIFAYIFVLGEKRADPEVEFAVTDKFRNYYKDYEETGLLPDPNCEYLDTVFDLCNYSEKKVVLDAVYSDKIIRYNVYYTEDADARLDSLTLVEDSVREREPESKSE